MTTPICTDDDLEARYGTLNIAAYADLDGDGTSSEITARKLLARTRATELIYDRLRATQFGFVLPLTDVPGTLVDIAVKLAGYWLSTARGVRDYDKEGNPITRLYVDYRDARSTLEEIAKGNLKPDVNT